MEGGKGGERRWEKGGRGRGRASGKGKQEERRNREQGVREHAETYTAKIVPGSYLICNSSLYFLLHFTFLKKDRQGDRKELFTRAIETEGILGSRYQVQLKVKKRNT